MAGTDTNKVTINVNGTDLEFTKIGNILGPAGKDGIDGKSIYAKTVDPWSVSGWNPAVAGDLFLNTTTGILWSAKAGAVTSNIQNNWTKVGELAGKITVDSSLSSTSTNPVQNKVIKSALDGKAGSSHSHSSLTNSSGRIFNVPTGGSGGEQKTLVITDDLNAYQPAGNYASSTHKHPISDINNLQSTIDGIYTDMGLQDEAIAGKADSVHTHKISNIDGLQSALNGKSNLDHNHDSVYQAKGDYATNDALKSYVTGTAFIDYTTYIEGEVNKKANASHTHEISNINGLQSALDGKSNSGHTHSEYVTGTDFNAYTSWIEGEVNGKAASNHTHTIANVSGLQSALDGKSGTGHTHTISNITNLQSTIDGIYSDMGLQDEAIAGKADIGHTHEISNINGLQSALDGKSGTGHTHTSLNTAFVFNNSNMPEGSTNLSTTTTAHKINFYSNGLSIPYQMDNPNDGGILRCRGNSESSTIFELGTWDDSGAGETIQFNYYPTTSQVTPTYSVSVPKKTGTIALTSDIPTSLPANGGNADTVDGKHSSDFYLSGSNITNLPINGGIYWNPYVESSSDGSDAASITVIKDGNGSGGTVLQIKQANDGNDIVNVVAGDLKVNGNSVINSGNIGSQNVNYANSAGSVAWGNVSGRPSSLPANGGNADTVDNEHASSFAHIGADNNLLTHTDEFTFASSGFSGAVWLNYRTAGGTNGNITEYKLGNGAGKALGSIIHSGNIGSQNVNYATSAGSANALASTGWGNTNLTYYQTSGDFYGNSGWSHYIIANHGSGETYYNYTIALPFWSTPKYKRQQGSTTDVSGWHNFITDENIGSQSVNYANSAGSARASNISMSSDGTTLTITYS